jgi:aminoglycoside phosphotransferase family enzyme/predicted kinase
MMSQLPEVAQALLDPEIYPDKTTKVEMMQTQMSFIFLTGKFVYKLRKAVNLGYLDYTTLEKRHFFSQQEVILNRRLSPEVYLGVIPVTKDQSRISLNGSGEIIDYVVKMLYLPQNRMMNVLLDRNRVTGDMVEQVAQKLVSFHAEAATNADISSFGKIEAVKFNTDENFSQTEKYFEAAITKEQFTIIKEYTNNLLIDKANIFKQRAASGKIRDCHGDLHSQHICFTNAISIFDCIEFNDRFRYCDVASEIAFLAMDMDHYGRADLSRSFTNAYINISRDEQIKEVLKFYKCYRACVRGKVACFKFDDPYISEAERKMALQAARSYFELAASYARPKPILFITVGLVGSGKSTLAQNLAKRLGLTVISSDVVRKQMASIPATEHHFNEMESGIYSEDFTRLTYDKLFSEASKILDQGDSVILDASFIKAEERGRALDLAGKTRADFYVLECTLDEANTRRRLARRLKNVSVSDGRWEIYGPQKKKFDLVTEINPENYFLINSALPLEEQIDKITAKITASK